MLYSIILPIYNNRDYVKFCLESIFEQDFTNYEIICIYSDSTDLSTMVVLDKYKELHKNIKIVYCEDEDLSKNIGIQLASGEYILFLENSNKLLNGALSKLSKVIKDRLFPDVIVISSINVVRCTGKDAYNELNINNSYHFYSCNYICKKKFIHKNNLIFHEKFVYGDEIWITNVLFKAENVSIIDFSIFNRPTNNEIQLIKDYEIVEDKVNALILTVLSLKDLIGQGGGVVRQKIAERICILYSTAKVLSYNQKLKVNITLSELLKWDLNKDAFKNCINNLNYNVIKRIYSTIIYFFVKSFYITKNYIVKIPNLLYVKYLRRFNKNVNPTIVSNNCWGGGIYEDLNIPYMSPTVGLFFYAPCYIKFVSNLKYYLNKELYFTKDSKYNVVCDYPIGIIDDIEIHFLHYKSEEEAYEKWNRRKQRVDYDNLYIKFCDNDLCTIDHVEMFSKLPFKKKVMFTSKKYSIESIVYLPLCKKNGKVGDLYNNRWKYRFSFNVLKWLN